MSSVWQNACRQRPRPDRYCDGTDAGRMVAPSRCDVCRRSDIDYSDAGRGVNLRQLDGNIAGAVIGLVLQGIYMVKLLSGARGQTVGNRVVATRVRDAGNGQAINLLQAFKRWGFIAVYSAIETRVKLGLNLYRGRYRTH